MKRSLRICGLVLMFLVAGHAAVAAPVRDAPGMLKTTYLGNEGFLIEGGGKKVLIDALFDNGFGRFQAPPADVVRRMIAGEKPFDSVDLLLVTHADPDHFDARLVLAFLLQHPHARLVALEQAVGALRHEPGFAAIAGQLETIEAKPGERTALTVAGVAVDALCLYHSYPAGKPDGKPSLAFAVGLGGARFLHMGDAAMAQNLAALEIFPFDREPVALLFMPYWDVSSETRKLIAERVKPASIVAMHLRVPPVEADRNAFTGAFPRAVMFEEPMEAAALP